MGRKTVAELEAENKILKEQNEKLVIQTEEGSTTEVSAVIAENETLKRTVAEAEVAQAKLVADIEAMAETETIISNGKIVGSGVLVMTPDEYAQHSKNNGRIMGRAKGQKTQCSIEELRTLINSNWTPLMIMEKHGMDAEDFKQLIWKLSTKELREKPIKYSIQRNTIAKEG